MSKSPSFEPEIDPAEAPHGGALPEAPADGADAEAVLAGVREALRSDPHDADYHFILGETLLQLGRLDRAAAALAEAVALHRAEPAYHYAHGAALARLGRHKDSAAAFAEAARLRPDDVRARSAHGVELVLAGSTGAGLIELREAVRIDPRSASAHNNLGLALFRDGAAQEALPCFERATRLRPDHAGLRRNLGLAQSALGRHETAVVTLRGALRLRPRQADWHFDLADALVALGRAEEALKSCAAGLELDPAGLRSRPESRQALEALRLGRLNAEAPKRARRSGLIGAVLAAFAGAVETIAHAAAALTSSRMRLTASLLALGAVGYAVWVVLPHYYDAFLLEDELRELAAAPTTDDAELVQALYATVARRGLGEQIGPDGCQVDTRIIEKRRAIRCRYRVSVELAPGLTRELRFEIEVDRPFFTAEMPKFL